MIKQDFTIVSDVGLHARPATLLVQEASRYGSDIDLTYDDKTVNVKSIMGVMSLGLSKGLTFSISADGYDEKEAMEGITTLLNNEKIVNVKSIMEVMSLELTKRLTFSIYTDGHDEKEAMEGITT